MKNKKLTYTLLLLVLCVWGIIIFQIIDRKPASLPDVSIQKNSGKSFTSEIMDYKYDNAIVDPFFRNVIRTNGEVQKKSTSRINKPEIEPKIPVAEVEFPRIEFSGLINNPSNNKKIAIISIDDVKHVLREGSTIGDYVFDNFQKDSIKVSSKNKSLFIKKE